MARELLIIPESRQAETQSGKMAELSKRVPKTERAYAYRVMQAAQALYMKAERLKKLKPTSKSGATFVVTPFVN